MNLKKFGKVFTSKFVGTGHSSYKKRTLPGCGLTKVEKHCVRSSLTEMLQIPMWLTVRSSRCRFMYSKGFHHDVPRFNTEQAVLCTYVCKTLLYLQFVCSSWHVDRSLDKICD